jgi:hypothetical protein
MVLSPLAQKWPMKHHEHRPKIKFGLKCLLICKLNQNAGGHVLMTKFGKSGKTGPSGFLFWTIWFWQFQSKAKEGAKFKDLKIQDVLKQEKGLKGIK